MDMEEYFYLQQCEIDEVIKKIDAIKISEYHKKIQKAKDEALKALRKLYDEFEF
jgi:hypothetical protein